MQWLSHFGPDRFPCSFRYSVHTDVLSVFK
jgi:hypothetical protein